MTRRRALPVAILGGWLLVVGWHVRREYFRPELEVLARGARALATGSHFYVVRMNDAAIGTATSRLDTVGGGFVFNDNIVLDIPAQGRTQRAVVTTRVELSAALTLRGFQFRMDSEIGSFAVAGVAASDSILELEIGAGGDVRRERVRVPAGVTFDAIVPLRLAASGALLPGREVGARIFDPSTLADREVAIRVTAADSLVVADSVRHEASGQWVAQSYVTIPVWSIEQSFGGVKLRSWVDNDGLLVRAESPLGFTIERTAYELAQQAWHADRERPELASGYGSLIEGTAIASNVALDDIAQLPRLAVRLRGVTLDGFDLAGGRQELRGDTLIVTRERDEDLRGRYQLPYTGPGEAAAELGDTPLIQSRDARIIAAARAALGGTTDPAVAAGLLNGWVYRALRKEITPSVPSALQVLEAKRGDCNEHTILYVALARAVGLPARTAAGLVHVRGRFYYHAWPEVWIAGRWVAVDPTLGQFPADASHLRFIVGGLARQVELVRLIGRLQLEVV